MTEFFKTKLFDTDLPITCFNDRFILKQNYLIQIYLSHDLITEFLKPELFDPDM